MSPVRILSKSHPKSAGLASQFFGHRLESSGKDVGALALRPDRTDATKHEFGHEWRRVRTGVCESAKTWLSILTELQNRGLKDIFIACCDGLTGFADAIETVFPKTQVQLCIVHMVRNSLS